MSPHGLASSLYVLYREAIRSPWICLSALRGREETGEEDEPPADARPVLVLGGFLSHPYYYAPLGRILTRRGYAVHFDEVFNAQPFKAHITSLARRIDTITEASGTPLRIVGHSLGGIHAMALLLERADAVEQVVAVAAPVRGGTPFSPLQRLVERVLQVRAQDSQILGQRLAPYAGRITTISSPQDLIAPPEACSVEGATNVVLTNRCRTEWSLESHGGVIFMRSAVRVVLRALSASLAPPSAAGPAPTDGSFALPVPVSLAV
jgi:pimeloyl-ACP methyl ester carboxylesterase